jgi:thymidylate synthase (FAD)
MLLIKPYYEILTPINGETILKNIERAGRTCYDSCGKITDKSYIQFCQNLINNHHESCLEHESISVKLIVDRGIMSELTRHRLCSFSVSSTRYIDFSKRGLTFIIPPWINVEEGEYVFQDIYNLTFGPRGCCSKNKDEANAYIWIDSMFNSEETYNELIKNKWTPQQARAVLPNSLKTEIICTANLREWRWILKLRTSSATHIQMQEIMQPLLKELQNKIPIIFDNIDR